MSSSSSETSSPGEASHSDKRVVVTGANSGLGFEAAAQLAELGYGSVVLASRSQQKADTAKKQLTARTQRDVFETLVVDLADIASSRRAAAELIDRDGDVHALILNAGMVPNELNRTTDGIEVCFGSSLVGHHILTSELITAGKLADRARVVIVGSEAANNDLPKAMGLQVDDFVTNPPADDEEFKAALKAVALGRQDSFDANHQYATTKAVSAWWSAAMQRRHGDRFDFFTVSPGANMGTNAARHTTGAFKVMIAVMGKIGHLIGMNQPVPVGARRYVDVVRGGEDFLAGRTYTSKPKKMTGDLVVRNDRHLLDERSQSLALDALDELVVEAGQSSVG